MEILPHYIVNSSNHKKVAVQLDIETFNKIEQVLEDYALYHLMQDDDDEVLDINAAKAYYAALEKN
jgi:hypothetical protein